MDLIGADTETGGIYPSVHALLSIGAVCTWDGLPFLVYVLPESQPGRLVDPEAAKVNGYTPELWARRGAVPIQTAMARFRDWLKVRRDERPRSRIIAHNLAFDRGFIDEAARTAGITDMPKRYAWGCSMLLFGQLMDDAVVPDGTGSLERLSELSGFWPAGSRPEVHDPLEDAKACVHGYQWLRARQKQPEETLRQLYTDSLRQRRVLEDAMQQLSVWYQNGTAEGRPVIHLIEEMTCLAEANVRKEAA